MSGPGARPEPLAGLLFTSTSAGPPLRVGVVLDAVRPTRAQAQVIDDIAAARFATLAVVAVGEAGPGRSALGGIAWRVYQALDERRVRLADDPLARIDTPVPPAG